MIMLVIYDDTGFVLTTRTGESTPREPIGVPFLWVDIKNKSYRWNRCRHIGNTTPSYFRGYSTDRN